MCLSRLTFDTFCSLKISFFLIIFSAIISFDARNAALTTVLNDPGKGTQMAIR